jgi:hypothetical protein
LVDGSAPAQGLVAALNDRFDQDYNVLLLNLTDQANRTAEHYNTVSSALNQSAVANALRENPLWQIAVYNPSFEPITNALFSGDFQIAVIPREIREDKIPVVFKDGTMGYTSSEEPPTIPTLYFSINERTVRIPFNEGADFIAQSLSIEPVASDDSSLYFLTTDCYNNGPTVLAGPDPTNPPGPPGPPGPVNPPPSTQEPCPTAERRFNDNEDRISRFQLASMTVWHEINDWFDGAQEFHITAIFGSSEQTVSSVMIVAFIEGYRLKDCPFLGSCEPQMVQFDHDVFRWRPELNGLNMKYVWLEHDSGDERTITSNLTGLDKDGKAVNYGSVEITTTDNSDLLGEDIVDYCDRTSGGGDRNSTHSIIYYIDQEPE